MKQFKNRSFINIIYLTGLTICTALSLIYYSHLSNLTITQLIQALTESAFGQNHNYISTRNIGALNFYQLIYIQFVFNLVVALSISVFLKRQYPFLQKHLDVRYVVFINLLNTFLWVTTLQTLGLAQGFSKEIKTFSGLSSQQRLLNPMNVREFAEFCKKTLPQQHSAEFITTLDLKEDPGMFIHRLLAYYLYPIDIRNIRETLPDTIIAFRKNDAAASIPEGYEIIALFDQNSLIARKKF